jgi:hypothetical protein
MYCYYKLKSNKIIRHTKKTNDYLNNFLSITSFADMLYMNSDYCPTKINNIEKDSNMCLYINDFRTENNKVPESENYVIIKFNENIKYKIRSSKIKTIELFRCEKNNFFNVVSRFHLPCVRAYYQDNDVLIMPTCMSAMMTGVNIEYNYFSGVRDPIDIINKYRMRGYGILLTSTEKKYMTYFNSEINNDPNNIFHEIENTELFGSKNINNKIFKPTKTANVLCIKSICELKKYYKTKYNYDSDTSKFDMFKFKTINSEGYITQLKLWISKEYYDEYYENLSNKIK